MISDRSKRLFRFCSALLVAFSIGAGLFFSGPAASAPKRGSSERCGRPLIYKVVSGDSLWTIARKFDVTVEYLKRLNGRKSDSLHPGDRLLIRVAKPCPKKKVSKKVAAKKNEPDKKKKPSKKAAVSETRPNAGDRSGQAVSDVSARADAAWRETAGQDGPASNENDTKTSEPSPAVVDESESTTPPGESGSVAGPPSAKDDDYTYEAEVGNDVADPDDVNAAAVSATVLSDNRRITPGTSSASTEPVEDEDSAAEQGDDPEADEPDDEDEDYAGAESDDAEPQDLPDVSDLAEFGFTDDGSACADYLGAYVLQPKNPKGRLNIYYKIRRGDTLYGIARKYKVPLKHLEKLNHVYRNPKRLRKLMHPGKKVLVKIGDPKDLVAARPFLKDWAKLKSQDGYTIKRSSSAYGRPWALDLTLRSICEMRRRNPGIGNVVVGDFSGRVGGQLARHLSHKTGRDVDLSYFAKNRENARYFIKVNRKTIDVKRSWELVRALLDTRQVEYIFMDWTLQKVLYEHALSEGVKKEELNRIFQYPAGRRVRTGIIRWARGHDDHIHVRFKCPKDDALCR